MAQREKILPGSVAVFGVVRVDQLPDNYQLLQDSQDCIAALESCGYPASRYEGDSFFALIGDGEYLELWRVSGFVPANDSCVKRIY